MLPVETVFLASEKPFFFFIYQISQVVKTVSPKGNVFLPNSSMQLVETNFMSSRNSNVLFTATLKILQFEGSNFFKRNLISARGS